MNTPTTKMNDMEVTKPRPAKEVKSSESIVNP
jgi:hypothetical protein